MHGYKWPINCTRTRKCNGYVTAASILGVILPLSSPQPLLTPLCYGQAFTTRVSNDLGIPNEGTSRKTGTGT